MVGTHIPSSFSSSSTAGELGRPILLTVDKSELVRGRPKLSFSKNGSGESADSGIVWSESLLELVGETVKGDGERVNFVTTARRGLVGDSSGSFFSFLERPRPFRSGFGTESSDPDRRRLVLPPLASGLIVHHELLPLPSFCTLTNLLCSDKLWRIEFCNGKPNQIYFTPRNLI